MTCFNCFAKQKSKKNPALKDQGSGDEHEGRLSGNRNEETRCDSMAVAAQSFNFRELATATKNFRQECLLGEGGFGRVYKGTLQATGEVVAVKQLDRNSLQGSTDFVTEVSSWSKMHHPNLVNFVGYCADGDQRLLVYEFMSGGSVEDRLRADATPDKMPMDWVTRMRIAYGAAQALEYLHDKAHPPVIYRDLKSSNVLLDEDMNPKLSHFGLSRLSGDKMPMQSRVMGTYGYCAPEYSRCNQLTTKADVYSFGIILLELVTGRSALDTNKPVDEQNLVAWALPLFRDPKNYPDMADPLLRKKFPERGLNQAVAIAAMCLQEESGARPLMSDVVTVLSFLAMVTEEKIPTTLPPAISSRLSLVIKDESFVESLSSGTGQDDKFSTSSETNLDQEEDSTLQDEDSDTTSRQSSWRSDDGGLSVSSSRGKNSKKPLFSISRKSSKFSEYGSFSSSNKGSRKSMFSSRPNSSEEDLLELGQKSTRKSKASRKSKGSKDYQSSRSKSLERGECSSSSSSQRIRRRSRKGIGASLDNSSSNKGNARRRNSRKGSQEGSVCNSS